MIQAIPTYMMSIFRLPDSLIADIQGMMARFWWGTTEDKRCMHWHSWVSMCFPKSKGGMGFRDLNTFNTALLAKQAWRIHIGANPLLAKLLKARYFKHDDILNARRSYDPSYTWRSLWGSKALLMEGLAWRVGNGSSIKVWSDSWIPTPNGYVSPPPSHSPDISLKVCDLIHLDSMTWNSELLFNLFHLSTVAVVLSIPLSPTPTRDIMF